VADGRARRIRASPLAAGALAATTFALAAWAAEPVAVGSAAEPEVRSVREWYALGGKIMHGLSLCSVLVAGLVLERSWTLRRGAVAPRGLVKSIRQAIEDRNASAVVALVEGARSALARLVRAALNAPDPAPAVLARGAGEAYRLRRNLPLLAAIGNLSTMLGLLGTVVGMIEAFQVITAAGVGDARLVAGGIFRALVTTAAGLGVGIAALTAHAFLSRKADDEISLLEDLTTELFEGKAPTPSSDRLPDVATARQGAA